MIVEIEQVLHVRRHTAWKFDRVAAYLGSGQVLNTTVSDRLIARENLVYRTYVPGRTA